MLKLASKNPLWGLVSARKLKKLIPPTKKCGLSLSYIWKASHAFE
jgi:hypothetical protein